MEAHTKDEKAILHCYRELYKHSNPSADFDELVDNATINERDEKEIPFLDYEISEELYTEIVESTIKLFKFNTKWKADAFRCTIALGCSPRTIGLHNSVAHDEEKNK